MRLIGLLLVAVFVQACAVAPRPDSKVPDGDTKRVVAKRVSAVVVTGRGSLAAWVRRGFVENESPDDADGGSATPITGDGYFLTADHVLANAEGKNVFVLFGQGGRLRPFKARVVWRDSKSDLAILKVAAVTPNFYRWTDPGAWLPAGTPVMHGGIATGFRSQPGRMGTTLPPERAWSRTRSFKMDIPLQPGDSGGPVVDAYGNLVGINSAVEFLVPMETAFFVDSEAKRPNIRHIEAVIRADRERSGAAVRE